MLDTARLVDAGQRSQVVQPRWVTLDRTAIIFPANGWVVCLVLVNRKIVDPVVRLSGNVELPDGVRIQDFNLVYRQDFYLRFLSVKFDFSGDADDFPLERGNLLVSRNF
jgi:hypothetical protein